MSRLRIRSIKPEFFQDKKVLSLEPVTRYLLIGLITRADDRGRQTLHEPHIWTHVFPNGEVKLKRITGMLTTICETKMLVAYNVSREFLLWFPHFWDHQVINRPSESEHPPHPDDPYGGLEIADAKRVYRDKLTTNSQQTHDKRFPTSLQTHDICTPSRARARPLRSVDEEPEDSKENDAHAVFDAWVTATGRDAARTRCDAKRLRVIARALGSHGRADCLAAVRNIGADEWARGKNDRGRRFDDVEHALGSAERIERWRDWTPSVPSGKSAEAARSARRLEWLAEGPA